MAEYEKTDIELTCANIPGDDTVKLAVGIIDTISGKRFGWYADVGIVHEEKADSHE